MQETNPSICPPGEAPWEQMNKQAEAENIPHEPSGPEMKDGQKLPSGDKLGDLVPFEIDMVLSGDVSPLVKRIEALSEGSERDQLVMELDEDLSHMMRVVDSAIDLIEEEAQDSQEEQIAAMQAKNDMIAAALDQVRTYNRG